MDHHKIIPKQKQKSDDSTRYDFKETLCEFKPQMQFETHFYELLIREHHLDSFGHVNNATYLELFEEARWQLITERGYGYEKVHELKIGPTILEIQLRFHKEVKLRQKIVIETRMESYTGKIGEIVQLLKDAATGEVHCTGKFRTALLDLRARKLILPTPEWLHAVGMVAPAS